MFPGQQTHNKRVKTDSMNRTNHAEGDRDGMEKDSTSVEVVTELKALYRNSLKAQQNGPTKLPKSSVCATLHKLVLTKLLGILQ